MAEDWSIDTAADHHAAESAPENHGADAGDSRGADRPLCGVGTSLLSALVGGFLTWTVFWTWYPVFAVPKELIAKMPEGHSPSAELVAEMNQASATADGYNAILFLGIWGALIAGVMVIGVGISRKNLLTIVAGSVCGGLIGAAAGCIAGALGWGAFGVGTSAGGFSPLARTICVQIAMLTALGGGVGLVLGALGKSRRSTANGLAYGMVAGVLSALIFPVLTALILVDASTKGIVPTGPVGNTFFNAQLLWIGVTSALLGLLIPSAFVQRKSQLSNWVGT